MLQIPKLGQISNFSAAEKRRKFGAVSGVTLNSLQQSVSEFQEVPDDIDEGYVLGASFSVSTSDEGEFAIVWSTVRLPEYDIGDVVHSDCTYRCTWNNYPVTIMGFSDKNRTFHPIIVAVSFRETKREFHFIFRTWKDKNSSLSFKYLMADATEAVYNAALYVWPGIIRLMCYAHVYMVRNHLYDASFFSIKKLNVINLLITSIASCNIQVYLNSNTILLQF